MSRKCITSYTKDIDDKVWFDSLKEFGINQTFRCFEMIGILLAYRESESAEDFGTFYSRCLNENRFSYRNKGITELSDAINRKMKERELNGEKKYYYTLSRSDLRKFGITYPLGPIRFYETYDVVLETIFEYILFYTYSPETKQERVREVFLRYVFKDNIDMFLTFENAFVDAYVQQGGTTTQNRYIVIRNNIEALLADTKNK